MCDDGAYLGAAYVQACRRRNGSAAAAALARDSSQDSAEVLNLHGVFGVNKSFVRERGVAFRREFLESAHHIFTPGFWCELANFRSILPMAPHRHRSCEQM